MSKYLVICNIYPLPENLGANIRTMNYVRVFEKLGEVDLAYTGGDAQAGPNKGIFSKEYHLKQIEYPNDLSGRAYYAVKGLPYPVKLFHGKDKEEIISKINHGYYDNVLIRYLHNTGILREINSEMGKRVIIDVDDVMTDSLYGTLFYETGNVAKKIKRAINKILLERFQADVINGYKTVFCSAVDKRLYAGSLNTAYVIPNIYENAEMSQYQFGAGYGNENILLFVGMLGYAPNVEGLRWFVKTIYKDYSKIINGVKLLVVGRSPSDDVKNICNSHESIELHANVDSLIPFYNLARAVVVPILKGGGTRIKILEAGLTGRPVLSTSMGAYGLDLKDGEEILLFENSNEFIKKYKKLESKEYYDQLGKSLRNTVEARFTQKSFEVSFYQMME